MIDNVVQLRPRPRITVLPVVDEPERALVKALPLLLPAIKVNERNASKEDIVGDLMDGLSLLWSVYMEDTLVAAFITSVVKHPQRNTLLLEYVGGIDMNLWIEDAVRILKEFAKAGNLDAIEADGRLGFSRIAKSMGFKEMYRHFEAEV
jgi:hypothetical protein